MIYRNGKKIGAIFRNGKAISKIFRNGKLFWQKAKPEAKRVKSITVRIPDWGTVERVEWESIFRAVPEGISNYYLDVTINGVGVRLRGSGGRYKSILGQSSGGSTLKIAMPENMFLTTDDLYVGQALSFSAKVPAVTSDYTMKASSSSYRTDAVYEFENAPFFPGSSINVELKTAMTPSTRGLKWTIKGSLINGTLVRIQPSVTNSGSGVKSTKSVKVVYTGDDYKAMATYEIATWMTIRPSFYITRSSGGTISKATLQSPESSLSYKFKITSIETY